MDDETKSRLERLQAEIRLQTGKRVTQQEILKRIVKTAVESKTEIIDFFREEHVPLTEPEKEAFHDGMMTSGASTREEDIDGKLYD